MKAQNGISRQANLQTLLIYLGIFTLICIGCGGGGSGGSSDDSNDNNIDVKSVTISADGGNYDILGMIIQVPAGAVDQDQVIEVIKYTEKDGEKIDESSIIPVYSIDGLQNALNGTITLKIPLFNTNLDIEMYIPYLLHMIEDKAYSISGGTANYLSMYESEIVDGYLVVSLPPTEFDEGIESKVFNTVVENNHKVNSSNEYTRNAVDRKSALQWFGGELSNKQVSAGGDISIGVPLEFHKIDPNLDQINNIIFPAIDDTVELLSNMGFDWSDFHKPMSMYIVNDFWRGTGTNYVEYLFIRGGNSKLMPFFTIDRKYLLTTFQNEMEKNARLKAAIGHEFFHAVQLLYVPNPGFMDNFDFLCEASSAWLEHKLIIKYLDSFYSPDAFPHNYDPTCFQNYGLDEELIGSNSVWADDEYDYSINTSRELGYGASYFFGYLTKYLGDAFIFDTWSYVKAGESKLKAIEQAVIDNTAIEAPQDMEDAWTTFAKSYNFSWLGNEHWVGIGTYSHFYQIGDNDGIFAFKMSQYSAVRIVLANTTAQSEEITLTFSPETKSEPFITAKLYEKNDLFSSKQLYPQKPGVIIIPPTNGYNLLIVYTGEQPGAIDVTLKIQKGASDMSCDWPNQPNPEYCSMGGDGTIYIDTNDNDTDNTYVMCQYYDWDGKLQFESPYKDGSLHGRNKFYFETVLQDWNLYENGVVIDYCD